MSLCTTFYDIEDDSLEDIFLELEIWYSMGYRCFTDA